MYNKNVNDEILKLAGSIDGLLSAFINYKSGELSKETFKQSQISFLKSLVIDEKNFNKIKAVSNDRKAKIIPKKTGFLYATNFLQQRLSQYNSTPIVSNFKYEEDVFGPLSLSVEDLLNIEFSDKVLNDNSITELWTKIVHWSNRTTKCIDEYRKTEFDLDELKKFKKYFRQVTRKFNTTSHDSNVIHIVNEIEQEKNTEDSFSKNLNDQLKNCPRLLLEHFTECKTYAEQFGIDKAVEEYSDYIANKSDYNTIDSTIKKIIQNTNKNNPISDEEYAKFFKYLTLELRIMRAYQIKAVAASEMILENALNENFPVYYRNDPDIDASLYSSNRVIRDKIMGILLPGYTQPIEIHCSLGDLNACELYVKNNTHKVFQIPKTSFSPPFRAGIPFKINEQKHIKISHTNPIINNLSLNTAILQTQDFLINSYKGKVNIPHVLGKENRNVR